MRFQITFIQGEKKGTSSILSPNQALSIGRSHTNNICLQTPDVSGRHIIIRPGSGGNITVEVLSSRLTKLNGKEVNIGDILEISTGDTVQLGAETAFVLEQMGDEFPKNSDEEKTNYPSSGAPASTDDDETATDISAHVIRDVENTQKKENQNSDASEYNSMPDANETVAFQTRIASDDELDNIKKSFRNKHRIKVLAIAAPILLFFVGAIFIYFYLKPATEEFVTWPTDNKDEYLNEFQKLSPYLAVVYPKAPGCKAESKGDVTKISTRTGKQFDVPLFLIITNKTDNSTLKQDHNTAFETCLEYMRSKSPTINWKGDKTTVFINESKGAGVPLSYVSYTRREENDDFFGYAIFLRNANKIHFVMMEVPLIHQWRAERFLRNNVAGVVIYAIRRTMDHWEGSASFREKTTAAQDLEEAASFMVREAPVYWGKIFFRIRSALIKATLANDAATLKEAEGMLVKLREQQATWYSTQKLAYQYAERNGDRNVMQSIQATCDSVFSSEFQQSDFRYDRIKRKDWK